MTTVEKELPLQKNFKIILKSINWLLLIYPFYTVDVWYLIDMI